MALTEETVVDVVTALEDGQLQVRTANVIKKDGVEISRTFSRRVVVPGDNLTNEDSKVKSIGEALHTDEVIATYEAHKVASREN
jgi:hypothetical protein